MFDPAVLTAFAGGLALPLLFRLRAARRFGLPVTVRVDPDDPKPEDFRDYLVTIAARLDEKPERMRARFLVRNAHGHRISLDLDADGRLVVSVEGHRPAYADIRRRGIADHPLPLVFDAGRRPTVLYVTPVDANRFRVDDRLPFTIPLAVYVTVSLVATASIVFALDVPLAAVLGVLAGSLIAGREKGT